MDFFSEETGHDVCGPCSRCPPYVLSYEELQAAILIPGDGLSLEQRQRRDVYWANRHHTSLPNKEPPL